MCMTVDEVNIDIILSSILGTSCIEITEVLGNT